MTDVDDILAKVDAALAKKRAATTAAEPVKEPEPQPQPEVAPATEQPETAQEKKISQSPGETKGAHASHNGSETHASCASPPEPEEAPAEVPLGPLKPYRAKFPDGSWFVKYLKLLKAGGAEEVTLNWNEDKIETFTFDPSHVCATRLEIRREAFEEYEAGPVKPLTFSVEELLKLFGRKRKKGWLELVYVPDGKNRLTVREGGTEWNSDVQSETTVPLLESTVERPPKINLTFDTKVRVEPAPLAEALADLNSISDYVKVHFSDDGYDSKMLLTSKSELGTREHRIPLLSRDGATMNSAAAFSLSYLTKFTKALKAEKIGEILFNMSTDKPLEIIVQLPAAEIQWLLAPRVEYEEPK